MTAPDRIWLDWFLAKDLYAYDTPAPKLTPKETEFVRRDPAVLAALPEVQALEDAAYERAAMRCKEFADAMANLAMDGLPKTAKARESMEATATRLAIAIRAMKGTKGMKPLGWLIGGWIFLVLSVWSLITDSPRADEAAFAAVFCFAVEQIIGEIRAMKGTKG